jgi:hypothetical protein
MLSGSISPAYKFVNNYADKAWAKQYRADHDVEQILYAAHALVAIGEGFLNGSVSFSTDGFMHG